MPASRRESGTDRDIAQFAAANPDVELARLDTYDPQVVAGLELPARRPDAVLAKLRAQQRMQRVTQDPATAQALIAAGLDSAHRIAMMPAHRFARDHADKFGGDEFVARQAHERATAVKAAVSHLHANLQGVLGSPHFAALHGNHADAGLADYFADIPSYQDLFGGLNFCSCQHCGSIFGPAAYFADVMRIIDDYITDTNPAIPAADKLAQRRPDLFELPLTCANTNDMVPMLQIVNAILARRIAGARQAAAGSAQAGGPASITLDSAASPDDGAYTGMLVMIVDGTGVGQTATITGYTGATRVATVGQTWSIEPDSSSRYVIAADPYVTLASAPYPVNLPWNQPLAQTRASLDSLRVALPELYGALAAPVTGGAAAAGGPATITLAQAASPADGAYDTMTITLTGGTGAGQAATITGYAGGSRLATVGRPWRTAPDDSTQYRIFDSLGADREQLGLSVEQYAIVTTPVTTGESLAPYFGLTSIDLAQFGRTEFFLGRTALSLASLTALLTQGLSAAEQTAGVADGFFINATGENLPALRLGIDATDPNAPVSVIQNLSLLRLDRLNRFIRLAAITGWGYEELNWALVSVAATQINEAAVKALGVITVLATQTGLTVIELCAFWSPLKTIGKGSGRTPADLFDRVFNSAALLAGQNPYTSVTPIPFDPARPLTWDPDVTTGQDGLIRARLAAALTVGDDDLTRLAGSVRALTGSDPASGGGALLLDLPTLSWLYRLATAARIFGLTVDEYLLLLRLMYHPGQDAPAPGSFVPTVDSVAAQRAMVDWFLRTQFTVYSVLYVLSGARTPQFRPPYVPDDLAPLITGLATSAEGSRLTPDSFVFGPVTPARSQQIFRGLVAQKVITGLGVLLDNDARYQKAALLFPLRADSFVSDDITPDQSAAAFAELQAADPPVLLAETYPAATATLSRSFNAETDLSFLFTGRPDAANVRNQVRTVLLRVRQCVDVTEFAFLFPITPDSFTSRAIPAAQSAHAFSLLADHQPPYILRDPAADQQRQITSYDGTTRIATVTPAWTTQPGPQSRYAVTTQVTSGTAAGGDLFTVLLDAAASAADGAYTGMTIAITTGPGAGESAVIADYDGDTKTATTTTAWVQLPDDTSGYAVTSVVTAGLVRIADDTHLTLDADASPTNGAYDGMQVTVLATGQLSADFDAATDLGFLFDSAGSGQAQTITGYDGPTRAVTVPLAWQPVPDDTTCYLVTRIAVHGTAQGGSSDTIVLDASAAPDNDAYDGMSIALTSGAGAGQRATVTGYDGSSRTATVTPPWTTMPDSSTGYDVVATVAQGTARGGDATHLFLAPDAAAQTGAYDDLAITLVPDPAADLKRGEVGQAMLAVLAQIEHTAGVVGAANMLQQDYATAGLADFLGTTPDRLAVLIPAATQAVNLAGYLDDLLTPIQGGQVPPDVPGLVAALARALVLFDTLGMSITQAFAVTEIPKAFNIADLRALTFDNVVALSAFMSLEQQFGDTSDELIEYFRRPADTDCPGPKVDSLAALTGWPAAQICQLNNRFWPAGLGASAYDYTTVDGLVRLASCFGLAGQTGLDVASLLQLDNLASLPAAGGNWQVYQAAAQLALDAVRARFGEPEFSQVNAQNIAALNEAARDALTGYAIFVLHPSSPDDPQIFDVSSLYEYLLIDVQVAGCAQTSPIVSGIAALQLYLQRCRLMLEPGVTDLSNIPDAWWEWMSAYRVWEANRRIFLYPENYLQPALRRGASPEFAGLAQTLTESDVTEKSAVAAYRGYFDDFAITGNLVIADAYQCPVPRAGTSVVRAQGAVAEATASTVTLASDASDLFNAYAGLRVSITSGQGSGQVRTITRYDLGRIATVDPPWQQEPDTSSRYVVTGPQEVDTLFLIGRTNTEPPVYYHRRHDAARGWTPWLEVGVTIGSPLVTPVYAFNRLHLFWAEQRAIDSSKIVTTNSQPKSTALTSVSAAVKYAYLDSDGTWSTAQTAVPDVVSDYEEDYALDPYVAQTLPNLSALFNPKTVYWQKVQPLHIPLLKVTQPQQYPNGEQVLINFGLSLQFGAGRNIPARDAPPTTIPAQQYAFEDSAYGFVSRFNTMGAAKIQTATGYLQLAQGMTVSGALTRSPVSAALISYLPLTVPQPYLPVLRRADATLGIGASETWNVILDDYWADSYPGLVTAPYPSPETVLPLLTNVSSRDASLTTVKNMPGSFVVGNGDESFLVRTSDSGVRAISDLLTATVDSPPFPAGFFYLRAAAFTSTRPAPPLDSLTFGFTRLSSRAALTLGERLQRGGIPDLLSLDAQRSPELPFSRLRPTARAVPPATDQLDFKGAYGPYFWEIFFHAPFLVAEMLVANRRFREAKAWLEYIYNPTQQPEPGDEGKQRFWRFLPLRTMDLPTLTQTLADPATISAYNDQPFDPDAIARLRISAYAKAIVMRYISNLLDWGDYLYAQDTRETVDEATNLYVMALSLLGPRPQPLGDCAPPAPASYNDIKQSYNDRTIVTGTTRQAGGERTLILEQNASPVNDAYTGMNLAITGGTGSGQVGYITGYDGATRTATLEAPWTTKPADGSDYRIFVNGVPQFLIRLENTAPIIAASQAGVSYSSAPFNDIGSYFCVPENDQLIAFWDKAEDRLFKIRHCMNIDGVVRALPLFAPPINPQALISGAAAGSSSPGVTPQLNLPVPFYRFGMLIQHAKELAVAVAGLGNALLSALEKKDAEAMALLQVSQQQVLLDLATAIKELTIEQTEQTNEALLAALASAQNRQSYYSELIATGLIPTEQDSIAAMHRAVLFNLLSSLTKTAASIGYAVPQVGSPFAMTYGGAQLGAVLYAAAGVFDVGAIVDTFHSQLSLALSQYERREAEWNLQEQVAEYDVQQIQAQLAANETQRTIAERDLVIHQTAIAQNEAISRFLAGKFSNAELYQWMSTRLSGLHFQTYSLALELARSAQRAFQYELNSDTTFVNFSYWDGTRRGLLAGEGLLLALNQMEKAYLERNSRALQIEKTISLAALDPLALRDLIETGECVFGLPEKLFDDDYPGHYARKIATLSVSVPAITGPYQNIHATLTQLANQVITTPDVNAVNFLLGGENATLPGADVLRTDWWVNQQIALSTGLGDDGVFDTAMDGRFLPFEGTGAVSTWRLSLPKQTNRFDFNAISDVIVSLRYQAYDGGARFRDQVVKLPGMSSYTGSVRLPLAQLFSSQWYEFLHQPADPARQTLRLTLADLIPPHVSGAVLTGLSLHLQVPDGKATAGRKPYLQLKLGTGLDVTVNLNTHGDHTQLLTAKPKIAAVEGAGSLSFVLADTPPDLLTPPPAPRYLDPAVIQNATLVLLYQGQVKWPSTTSR